MAYYELEDRASILHRHSGIFPSTSNQDRLSDTVSGGMVILIDPHCAILTSKS